MHQKKKEEKSLLTCERSFQAVSTICVVFSQGVLACDAHLTGSHHHGLLCISLWTLNAFGLLFQWIVPSNGALQTNLPPGKSANQKCEKKKRNNGGRNGGRRERKTLQKSLTLCRGRTFQLGTLSMSPAPSDPGIFLPRNLGSMFLYYCKLVALFQDCTIQQNTFHNGP